MRKTIVCIIALASVLSAISTVAHAKNPVVGGAPMYATKNIVENAMNSKDHTTLVAAVKAAGLVGTLEGKGPFTVFAPTNEAFGKLPAGTVETLLKPENKSTLVKILTCHVVAGDEMAAAIRKMSMGAGGEYDLKTVGGCTIKAMDKDGKLTLTDEAGSTAHVTIADVKQSNGVIHVVDAVLLPKM
jgi:uncharacterized surface protein with fasciclin (FAS1) repeats